MTRRAVTLLELIAVVTILGIFAVVALSSIGTATLGNLGARADARRVAVDLLQTRRRSIVEGENHYLAFTPSAAAATGYTVYRRTGSGDVAVAEAHEFPRHVVVSSTDSEIEFTFEGGCLTESDIDLSGQDHTWNVHVSLATGSVTVTQTVGNAGS